MTRLPRGTRHLEAGDAQAREPAPHERQTLGDSRALRTALAVGRSPITWTNKSVRLLAAGADPVERVLATARAAVLEGLDAGWEGPPFDPIGLADVLKLRVVPRADVAEARTIADERGTTIEFNPNRSPGRRRFSIAHEIAHTFFPDYAEQVRHRAQRHELRGDEWQLEALCNVAAAELLMPTIRLPERLGAAELTIERLLQLRRKFDVSMEALLLRVVRVAEVTCAVFCASPVHASAADTSDAGATGATEASGSQVSRPSGGPTYRLDYLVAGQGWHHHLPRRLSLPARSAVAQCAGIGFTASGDEVWAPGTRFHIECVGIPPYIGSRVPRVVGVLTLPGAPAPRPAITYRRGDATARPADARPTTIVHLVNDKTATWGAQGFAAALRRRYPEVQRDFRDWAEHRGRLSLGDTRIVHAGSDVWVATIVAQHGYGPKAGARRLRYTALEQGLRSVAAHAEKRSTDVQMPRVGAGQAGGSWDIIQEIIEATLGQTGVPVTVFDLPDAPPPPTAHQAQLRLTASESPDP